MSLPGPIKIEVQKKPVLLSDVYKAGIFILLLLSSLSYVIAGTIGVDPKIINLGFNLSILLFLLVVISFLNYYPRIKFFNPLNYFIFVFIFSFVISLCKNHPQEWLPSFLRFGNYILVFTATYIFCNQGKLGDQFVAILVNSILILTIAGGFYEIFTGQVQFLNGAYRVAGHYDHHPLGYGLLLYVLLSYIFIIKLLGKTNLYSKIWYWVLFICGFYLFISTHSRMLMAAFFITNFLAYVFISRNVLKAIIWLFVFIAFSFLAYFLILNTELAPRIRETFGSSELDNSTLYRLFIISESLKGMSTSDYLTGIGMGGFNSFFYDITGEDEVAAHNDYLLWIVEGGIISIALYILFQIAAIREIISKAKQLIGISFPLYKYGILSFVLFVGIEIFSFLLNPHYFYQSENLMFLIIGFFAGNYSHLKGNLKT